MKRVISEKPKKPAIPSLKFTKPLTMLWSLSGGLVPAIGIYGLVHYGSPGLLISDQNASCSYLDLFGSFEVRGNQERCSWCAFRALKLPKKLHKLVKGEEQ